MYCLHCGDCCLRMCPMNYGECEFVKEINTFYFCSIYEDRPKRCANHDFPAQFCPIGLSKLGLKLNDIDKIKLRIITGWKMIKAMDT